MILRNKPEFKAHFHYIVLALISMHIPDEICPVFISEDPDGFENVTSTGRAIVGKIDMISSYELILYEK